MKILSSPGQYTEADIVTPVPFSLSKHLYPFGIRSFRTDRFGSYLLQKVRTMHFSLHFTRFDIQEQVTLYGLTGIPVVGLHLQLQGSPAALLPGHGKKMFEEGYCEMLYLPPTATAFTLETGVHESCWLELHHSLICDMAEKYSSIRLLYEHLAENRPVGHASVKIKMSTDMKSILKEMREYNMVKTPEKIEVLLYGAVYKLLSLYDDNIKTLQYIASLALTRVEEKLLLIQLYIKENADIHECSLSNLAQQFHIPKDTLKVNFKKKFGIPLYKFVQEQCMLRARKMVYSTNHSAASIANELGYENSSNFSKVFKKYFNCSLMEMRKGA